MPHSKVGRPVLSAGHSTGRPELTHDGSVEARIGAHIQPQPNGCWLYNGSTKRANVRVRGKYVKAYWFVYETLRHEVVAGFVLHHECESPGCVNPDHLLCCTQGEHMARHAEMRRGKAKRLMLPAIAGLCALNQGDRP